jgi:hypothetical protein
MARIGGFAFGLGPSPLCGQAFLAYCRGIASREAVMILRHMPRAAQPGRAFVACTALCLALLIAALSGQAAYAFSFTNADGSSGNESNSGFSGYKDLDVNSSRLAGDSADKSTTDKPKSGFYFGSGAQSIDQRYSGDRYFTPNSLMGR